MTEKSLRIIFAGRTLANEAGLAASGITEGSSVHCAVSGEDLPLCLPSVAPALHRLPSPAPPSLPWDAAVLVLLRGRAGAGLTPVSQRRITPLLLLGRGNGGGGGPLPVVPPPFPSPLPCMI